MNPFKLALLTLGCALVLAITPIAARKLFPPRTAAGSPGAASVDSRSVSLAADPFSQFLSAGKPSGSGGGRPAVALASERAPSVRESLPAPLVLNTPAVKAAAEPQTIAAALPGATPKPVIPYRAEVARAQDLLLKLGVKGCSVDGKLGPRTSAAVADFQKAAGLADTGQVDPVTLGEMEKKVALIPAPAPKPDAGIRIELASAAAPVAPAPESKVAAPGVVDAGPMPTLTTVADVTRIQEKLAAAGAYSGPVDGKWGQLTKDAMKSFQQKNSLATTGRPDKVTWEALVAKADAGGAAPPDAAAVAAMPVSKLKSVAAAAVAAAPAAKLPAKPEIELVSASKPSLIQSAVLESPAIAALPSADAEKLEVSKPADEPVEAPAPEKAAVAPAPVKPAAPAPPPAPAAAKAGEGEIVVKLNNVDAGKPAAETIATPVAVSTEAKPDGAEVADKAGATPAAKSAAASATAKRDTNPALEKELAQAQARIAIAMSDSRYELKKYAPQVVDSVNDLAGKVQTDVQSNARTTPEVRKDIVKLESGLEEAKKVALRKKAEDKVAGVDAAYKSLTVRFKDAIAKEPFKGTAEKISAGYEAMKTDMKKGNYDPIVERCDGFRLAIEMLTNDVAEKYLADKLGRKSVKQTLNKSTLGEIDKLRKEKKFIEAADLLDSKSTKTRKTGKN
jgi:peptidoglycan hydrolase-like protein with peptidoglycan-binding domain